MKKTVLTITGIRPDFIRMSSIFANLDTKFDHRLVHTGQHYDKMLSDVFFSELKIRKPDFNLEIGGDGKQHYHQTSELSVKIIELLQKTKLNPSIILFLGDSNSVASSVALKKEGYTIGHIEAGMRSRDKRMLEEINRTVCDHCSDYHFVYHDDYKANLVNEGLPEDNIFVVGNTVIEPCKQFSGNIFKEKKKNSHILLDIHRPENFKYKDRLKNIIQYANLCIKKYDIPVKMLRFGRTVNAIRDFGLDLGKIQLIDLMSYRNYLTTQYHSLFIITDSGTGQEEPGLLQTPAIVPRDYTERPQSIHYDCSYMLNVSSENNFTWQDSYRFIKTAKMDTTWLGDGKTSTRIIDTLQGIL